MVRIGVFGLLLRQSVPDPEDIEDIVQEVFYKPQPAKVPHKSPHSESLLEVGD